MTTTTAHHTLARFRDEAYRTLGHRKDSLFELMEAVLSGPGRATLVRLSLAPAFRRRWPSACDALADGDLDAERCRGLVQRYLPARPASGRPVWAGDGTVWPRPAAKTSPERTFGHRTTPGLPQSGLVPAWEYEWLVQGPGAPRSWAPPPGGPPPGPAARPPTPAARPQT